ncbi:MAG: hypothetical protein WCO56_06950 [Verrucomicrobiota bacterium]
MFGAILATLCFSISVVAATRSARLMGGTEANFWRLTLACLFLGIVATTPIVILPLTARMEGERPSRRALFGGLLAVLGAAGLTLTRFGIGTPQ